MEQIGHSGFHPPPGTILMTEANLVCLPPSRDGEQVLKQVCKGRKIAGMNDIACIDGHAFLGSIPQDTLDGSTDVGHEALGGEESDGIIAVFDEHPEALVTLPSYVS